jgi:pantetheine-phosphate adenylyltransferase
MPKHQRIAVYPGSFDPITNGHLDIIARASRLFDRIIVAVSKNPSKTPTFTFPERTRMITMTLKKLRLGKSVSVDYFEGLLVSYCRRVRACAVVRGLRAVSDFEYEFQMALMNRRLAKDVETVFLMPDERYVYLSSSLVKEVARLGGDLKAFVPPGVKAEIDSKKKQFERT